MWGLLFQKSALVCLVFYLVAVICASSKRGNDHGILSHQRRHRNPREHKNTTKGRNPKKRPYQSKHHSSGAHLNKDSTSDFPASQDFILARRDYVPQQHINMPLEKNQNIFEKYYGNQGYPQMGDGEEVVPAMERNMDYGTFDFPGGNMKSIPGAKARKINPNDLGYSDLKRVEDADQSVNEVINSILGDDKNLEKAMSDDTGYRKPTPNPSEDFDVNIEENTEKTTVGSSYLPTKLKVPEVVKGGLQAASQVDGSHQTLQSYNGMTNGTGLAHSWSVDLDSAGNNEYPYHNGSQSNSLGRHGNVEGTNPLNVDAGGSNISNHIGNPGLLFNQGSKGKEDDSNVYSEVVNKVDRDSFKQSLNSGNDSVLSGGKNKEISSSNDNIITSDIVSTKLLNVSHEASGYISKSNRRIESTNLGNLGDEAINNGSNQIIRSASNVIYVTNIISDLHGKNNPISAQSNVAVLENTAYENSIRNSSNTISQNIKNDSTRFDNEESDGSGSHGNTAVTIGNDDSSKSNNGNVHVEIIERMPKKDDRNGRQDSSHGNTDNQLEQNGKEAYDNIDNQQNESAATSSSFLKQHPNAFKILMEYFRKETSLQQKLRNRLNALRKTQINENAMKKSFASVHELEEMPKRPLPLRDFVADFLKFASENVPQKAKSQIISKAKASKQEFLRDKGKLTRQEKSSRRRRKPIVGLHRKIAVGLHNSVQASKQALPSRKADVTFIADFENVTEVAKEINGNITKIFQDAMNSNSQDSMKVEPSASSTLGLAEERIGKIIAQNEIPQNVTEQYPESNARNEEETSVGNNNAIVKEASGTLKGNAISVEATGPYGSNARKVEAIAPVESNAMPNLAIGPLVNHSNAISKAGAAPKKSDPISKEAFYSIGQTSPSEALYDFIHAKSSYMDSKTMMYKRELKSLEVSLSQDFFNFWMYHYRSFEEMSIKPQQLRSGIATVGSTDRLERVIKKALKGERINILIVGGSISAGGGLERDRHDLHGIYYKAFVEWWKTTVTPITTSDLKLNVVAIGGTDSEYFSYCIKNYIHDHPDLVLWELAANDYRRYEKREMDPGKPLEQLTRLLLTLPSQPALIFINYFRGDYYKSTLGQDCPDSEDESGRLMAEYYKITSLSWRNIICSQIKTDVRPSNSAKREFPRLTLKTLFSSDGYHPSLLGHAQCATLLISYIRSVFEEVVSREISRIDKGKADDNTKSEKSNLPMPIYGDPVAPNPMCWTLLTSDFHRPIENQLPGMRIIEANGFEFTNITRWPVRMDRLRCLKALHSDASLRIKFHVSMNNKSSTKRDVAVISHNSFSGSARVWLDNDQNNAVIIDEPSGQRRTQANIIKRVLQPGSHVITIRSITPGFCVSALAIL